MRIGIDFDNTILNYDKVFAFLSKKEFGLNYKNLKKSQIRKKIIKIKSEKEWMRLQGLAYGKFIMRAEVNHGVQNFIKRLLINNHHVFIVSHKTLYGHYDVSKTNLRMQAFKWLDKNGFTNKKEIGIIKKNIFFAESITNKIKKINELKLDYFIDDLLIILTHQNLNKEIKKIHFSNIHYLPTNNVMKKNRISTYSNFRDISLKILGEEKNNEIKKFANSILNKKIINVEKKYHSGNSRIYRITSKNKNYCLKYYPDRLFDGRNRIDLEFDSIKFLHKNKITKIPKPIKKDVNWNIAIYSWVNGRSNIPANKKSITELVLFIKKLKKLSDSIEYDFFSSKATEACLSINEIFLQIEKKIKNILLNKDNPKYIFDFINFKILPIYKILKNSIYKNHTINYINRNTPMKERVLSPADFGFHNTLSSKGSINTFIDFEYFGWDDPVKLVSDFCWHPAMNISEKLKKLWIDEMTFIFKSKYFEKKFEVCFYLYGIRWSLIILNIFTVEGKLKFNQKHNYKNNFKYKKEQYLKSLEIYLQIANKLNNKSINA